MAFISWWYNRVLSKPLISFDQVHVEEKREVKNIVKSCFTFLFKNIGKEPAVITKYSIGLTSLKFDDFNEMFKKEKFINPILPGSTFSHTISLDFSVDPDLSDDEIKKILPKIVKERVLITIFRYKVTSIFSKKETTIKFYSIYLGLGKLSQLNYDEYKEIESKLPKEYKLKL